MSLPTARAFRPPRGRRDRSGFSQRSRSGGKLRGRGKRGAGAIRRERGRISHSLDGRWLDLVPPSLLRPLPIRPVLAAGLKTADGPNLCAIIARSCEKSGLGAEPLAPARAPGGDHPAPALGGHAGAETVTALAHQLARLIGPLHGSVSASRGRLQCRAAGCRTAPRPVRNGESQQDQVIDARGLYGRPAAQVNAMRAGGSGRKCLAGRQDRARSRCCDGASIGRDTAAPCRKQHLSMTSMLHFDLLILWIVQRLLHHHCPIPYPKQLHLNLSPRCGILHR